MFGNKISFSCQSNLPFCGDDDEEIRPKTYRGLPQASHGNIELMTFALTWCANIFVGRSVTPNFFSADRFLF